MLATSIIDIQVLAHHGKKDPLSGNSVEILQEQKVLQQVIMNLGEVVILVATPLSSLGVLLHISRELYFF